MKSKQIEKYHYQKDKPESRQFDMFDLAEYFSKNATHSSQPHTHSFYQIIWFKSNEGTHFIDFEAHAINSNRLFFIAKNQVHSFEQRPDYEGYLIHFNESFILSNETDINFFLTYTIFNSPKAPYFQIPEKIERELLSYFAQLKSESKNTDAFGNKALLSHLLKATLLLVEREKRKSMNVGDTSTNQNSTYLKFRDLLENNFHLNWSVADFANQLSISTKTLNAITKSEMGKTVSQAIKDRVILEAKRKLSHSNAFVNQIAFDLGFKDPYYFIRYFKNHVKCSPSEFRKSFS